LAENTVESVEEFTILHGALEHLDGMVRCHLQSFPGEFMTLIGRRFIRGFYRFYIRKKALVFVAVNSAGGVIGLICGGKPELRQNFSRVGMLLYAPDIIFGAIRNSYARRRLLHHISSGIDKLLKRLFRKRPSIKEPSVNIEGSWASLLSVCTVPDQRGRGVGTALIRRFEAESQAAGYNAIRLSVHSNNEAAISLYKKCGWEVVSQSDAGVYFVKRLG